MEFPQRNYPQGDGWTWVYWLYHRFILPHSWLRNSIASYFNPSPFERAGSGRIYRLLGVHVFGKIIPTGGVSVRRFTKLRMIAYTLRGPSLGAARDFRYKTCIFEALHMPFCIVLLILSVDRFMKGHVDWALEDLAVNLLANIYPMMHHRYTRIRIDRLVGRLQSTPQT